jgi:hypothetical protein
MKKVDATVKEMSQFAGKWVAVLENRVIAVGKTLKEISPLVTRPLNDKTPDEKIPAAFKVPRKDEGPYILHIRKTCR